MRPYGVAQQRGEKLFRFLRAQGSQPQLGVVGLTAPLGAILGAVVHQQEEAGTGYTLTQGVEKTLRLGVDPVQVFKDEDEGLVETLAQEEAFQGLKDASAPNLGVHVLEAGSRIFDAK